MRIVSVNAWGGAMHDELVAWLPAVGADLVGLQEVTRTPGLSGWTSFADGERELPQRADLMSDVAAVLPRHDAWFTVSDTGPVVADGRTFRQDFGLGLFAGPSLSRLASVEAHVHGGYLDHGDAWPHTDRPRAAQVARFRDERTGGTVTVGHLHGLRDAHGKGDSPARRLQAERLASLIEDVRDPDDVVAVFGDLNVLPDSETFAILRRIGLTDLVGSADTRTGRYPKPVRHASYLLVSDPGGVRHFEVVQTPEVSDHRALVLDL